MVSLGAGNESFVVYVEDGVALAGDNLVISFQFRIQHDPLLRPDEKYDIQVVDKGRNNTQEEKEER